MRTILIMIFSFLVLPVWAGGESENKKDTESAVTVGITDCSGRTLNIPDNPEHVICSGPGALRLLVYLQAQEKAVAVDDIETKRSAFDARPYALANPRFKSLPTFGEFRGHDNPELILSLDPQPDVIFKTYSGMGYDPVELQNKTGIPVVVVEYGNLTDRRDDLYGSLRLMGKILHKEKRAEDVIEFMENAVSDLENRSKNIPESDKLSCYVGGIAHKGPHGLQSTEPAYPPFLFTGALNVAYNPEKEICKQSHADIAKEQILHWDPDVLFIDVSTLQSDEKAGALYELKNDAVFANLKSVREGNIYGVLPYNWYTTNFGSVLANGYYVGKILYPQYYSDIDPEKKADSIYQFLNGKAVFGELDSAFSGLAFSRITF